MLYDTEATNICKKNQYFISVYIFDMLYDTEAMNMGKKNILFLFYFLIFLIYCNNNSLNMP